MENQAQLIDHQAENIDGFSTVIATTKNFEEEMGKTKAVIVLVPGNPGLIEFYEVFMEKLHELRKLPIIGFSHAGIIKYIL